MLNIAICDDEKYFRNEIREILDRQGYYRNTLGDVIKDI